MSYTEAQITDQITNLIRNIWSTVDWGTAALSTAITEGITKGLREIAREGRANVGLATVTTSAGTKDFSISGVSNMLHGYDEESFEAVEFRVDKDPPRFRSFEVRGSRLAMDISFMPDASEDVRLYVRQPHVLSGTTTNTLDPVLEPLFVDLVASHIAVDKEGFFINAINVGGSGAYERVRDWGERKLAVTLRTLRALRKPPIAEQWPRVV